MRIPISAATFVLFLACSLYGQDQPKILSFSPQGTVKNVRQVRARFSHLMVPFGDLRAESQPFEISCPERGTARWVDPTNWVYDFDEDLPAGIRCEFRLRTGLKTLNGTDVTGQTRFAFSTGGPAIMSSIPNEGSDSIDENQIFILELDVAATDRSILSNAWFSVTGLRDRVGVRTVAGKERDEILKATYRYRRDLPPHLVLIQAKQRFPEGTKISLVWGRGIQSSSGVATSQDQALPFETRTAFRAEFECTRENADAACVPISPMVIRFSAPVAWDDVKDAAVIGPGGRKWAAQKQDESERDPMVYALLFKGPFPEKSAFTVQIPAGVKDDSGRALTNASNFPLKTQTDEYPPLAKFAADFGIIELKGDAMLPVTVRNIEPQVAGRMFQVEEAEPGPAAETTGVTGRMKGKIVKIAPENALEMLSWINKIGQRSWEDRERSVFETDGAERAKSFSIPKLEGPKSFEVIGIPMKSPGFYVVEIESEILGAALIGQSKKMFVPTTALVTNLAVHFKQGIDSSLVWVTTLDKAKPATQAAVRIQNCRGEILWQGRTDDSGIARVGPLPDSESSDQCSYERFGRGLLVTVQSGEDFSFVHTSWDDGIEPWRFSLRMDYERSLVLAHTVMDRSLFRAGETVHMKHIIRKHTTAGFAAVPPSEIPQSVVIYHLGSDQKYEFPVQWDGGGIAENDWAIPKNAKLGTYNVYLVRNQKSSSGEADAGRPGEIRELSGSFRVEEFRVPLMRAIVRPPAAPQIAPQAIPVDVTVAYLAGGGAANLPVKLRSQIQEHSFIDFDRYERFIFSNGRVKEGVFQGESETQEEKKYPVKSVDLILDRLGSARSSISDLPTPDKPLDILTELEFKDPNGEVETVSSRISLWPSSRLIGIRPASLDITKESLRFQVAVTDLQGNPVAGVQVSVDLFERKVYSHRKRLVGGFYAYEHSTEVKRLQTLCQGKTGQNGLLSCDQPSPVSGNVILQASTEDSAGRNSTAWSDVWIAGEGEWWFAARDDDRIDIIPEQKRYEVGEKARFQVRMPFRTATALVTLEREGVGEAFVKELSGKQPVIEIPVKGSYGPNIFVSVLVVRGRVTDVQPTATVDLGRPAYKLGIAEIQVGWRPHELKVAVNTDKPVYKVRDKARVIISVKTADGKLPPPGGELAFAAVDEGLLELSPNASWQLLDAMMERRGYAVQTCTAQMHVVGKRHFGLKALPQGGGGGSQVTRELFDTLLLWKGRVQLDSRGQARIELPLNDSITSFRIVAVATQGNQLYGTGTASIRSTQDLIIFSGIGPLAREGDRIESEFTLRNATERPMNVLVSAQVKELGRTLDPLKVSLGPGEAKEVGWDVTVPVGLESLSYELEARGDAASDRLKVAQKIAPAVPVRTFQATLEQVAGTLRMDVRIPGDAIPGRGGVQVSLKPSLVGAMTGVSDYMSRYPFSCLEQMVSKAIVLRDVEVWNNLAAQLPSFLDSDGLLKYFPLMRLGSDVLTSYVLAVSHEAGWQIPPAVRQRMVAGLRGFVEGKVIRYSALPTADLAVRKIAAVEALSRSEKVEPGLLTSIAIDPNLWPTSAVIDWFNILRAVAGIPNRDARLREADQILRTRLQFQGTTMAFSTELTDACWWLMTSTDTNSVRLLLSVLGSDGWKADVPRLVRGALGRQHRGRWDTTVSNAWGVLAIEKYSRAFEKTPVSGTTSMTLAGGTRAIDWAATPGGASVLLDWPQQQSPLSISMTGTGEPYATVQSMAAIPLKEPVSSGFRIRRTLTGIDQKQAGVWSKGDIVRVRLDLESSGDMTWVVVNDPIPAGATILGGGLGRDSSLAIQGEERKGWVWPAFEERSFESFRAYFEYVPKGTWTLEYTMRLNAKGSMNLPPSRIEALYSPEMFAEIPNAPIRIE
jgi:alpha-2-macroglobulin